ncbi:hypothetical protein [Streptomyces clavuligerus]|uniref:hypothetical protein n=1 Tax=Streptomyces clavuligerus TaxID=1901 RepID=UPI0002E786A6|nr:hypothetical protein [Streptomyces clavuligerus]WDN56126.1 hypothetical protein LL058_30160 [Streptomyces clavuligerus]
MSSRIERAARMRGCAPQELPGAVSAFLDEVPPRNALAQSLARQVFALLDGAPLGTFMIGDLERTAGSWPELPRTFPVMPWQAVTLVDSLAALLRDLDPSGLRDAAEGFALRRGELAIPLRDAHGTQEDSGDEAGGWFAREERLLDTLAVTGPRAWSPPQTLAVRAALLGRLAGLGDGLLRLSEHEPRPLEWTVTNRTRTAYTPVPGSPNTLQARLARERARARPPGRWDEVMWGTAAVPVRDHWRWEVGWPLPGGAFVTQEGTAEATCEAAVFAAEQTVAALLRRAPGVRQRFTGRLLVPRTRGCAGGSQVRVVSLRALLLAVFNEDRSTSGEQALWPPVPHTTPDHGLGSFAAALFDHIGVPCPSPGERANTAPPGTEAFTGFLAEHAVVLTPPARAYLTAASAGEGDRPLRERHASGLDAVLHPSGAEEADRLTADMGPLPAGVFAWTDLLDPAVLERFLDDPAPGE